MAHTSKTFQSIQIYFTKSNKTPYGICINLFFASEIILIFGGLFLHRLSRLLKVNLNSIMVPTTDFARQKCRTRRDNNPNSRNPSYKARIDE